MYRRHAFDLSCAWLWSGDEVIVPSQTHVATAHAVELTGARPVFVDANIDSGNMDVSVLESLITPRTKALAVVHYLGVPADMQKISEIAKKHGLFLLEDCALSPGASFNGVHTGLIGDAGCFSFYPVKHLTTAEGGMIILKDQARPKNLGYSRRLGSIEPMAKEAFREITMWSVGIQLPDERSACCHWCRTDEKTSHFFR